MTDSQPLDFPAVSTSPAPVSSTIGSYPEQCGSMVAAVERSAEGRALLLQIQSLDRAAFRPELIRAMLGAPTVDDIKAYAARNPDRWAAMVATMARLAGYSERPEDGASLTHPFASIGKLSDSELLQRLEAIDGKLDTLVDRKRPAVTVDAEFREPTVEDLM